MFYVVAPKVQITGGLRGNGIPSLTGKAELGKNQNEGEEAASAAAANVHAGPL